MSCGVGHRHSSDLVWLWLWRSLAATALIQPLAWELPYAAGSTLKRKEKKLQTCWWSQEWLAHEIFRNMERDKAGWGSGGQSLTRIILDI